MTTAPPPGESSPFDVAEADRLHTTTRAVRRRLDFERPVPDQVILDCIDVAEQAPSGGNDASRRWIIVKDPEVKARLGNIYRESGSFMRDVSARLDGSGHEKERVFSSSAYLTDHFADAPALVIAAIWGVHDNSGRPGLFDSVIQAAWSFNLALRARGLGSCWTTILNANVEALAGELSIPADVTTIVTFPVAYTIGTDFGPVDRRPAADITYFDEWGFTQAAAAPDADTPALELGPGVVAEIDIDASPHRVWPHLTDISLPAQFSDEFLGAEWSSDDRGLGATFVGRNQLGDRQWEVECHVTGWAEGRIFEWATIDPENPGALWRLEANGQGTGTRLRFSCRIGATNNRLVEIMANHPDRAHEILAGRRRGIRANLQATIAGIKSAVEAAG